MQQCLPPPPPASTPTTHGNAKHKPHTYLLRRSPRLATHPAASQSTHPNPPTTPSPLPSLPSPRTAPFHLSPSTIHQCTYLPPSTHIPPLRNRIHPLFSACSFPSLSPETYALLIPALRLASHLLLSKRSLRWWCTTLLSSYDIPLHFPSDTRRPLHPILHLTPPTPHNLALAKFALRAHASHLTFHFQTLHGGYGFTHRSHNPPVRIALSAAFLNFLLSSAEASAPLAQKLRFRLLLAVSMLHEVAHAGWMLRATSEDIVARWGDGEPLHGPGEREAELGRSWERGVFGGRVQSVGFGVGCEEGLVWVGERFWGVGMGWVVGVGGGRGSEEEVGMRVGEGVRVPFSEEGWARRGL